MNQTLQSSFYDPIASRKNLSNIRLWVTQVYQLFDLSFKFDFSVWTTGINIILMFISSHEDYHF